MSRGIDREARAWLDAHPSWERPTEFVLPIFEVIGPTWSYNLNRGGWFAQLVTKPNPTGEPVAECDHIHESEDDAWTCARALAYAVIREALAARVSGDSEAGRS